MSPHQPSFNDMSGHARVDPGLSLASACEDVWFVDDELDEAIDEMAIATELPREIQRAVMGRAMLCLSLAASVADEGEFERAARDLIVPMAPLAVDAGASELAGCMAAMLQHGARQIEAEMAGLPEFSSFATRVSHLVESAQGIWSLH